MTFGLNVTTQNLHSVQLFANTKRVNFLVFFWIFEVGLRSIWPSKPMKMTFLLFCVVIFNDTRFFLTYFAVHCCLVWCVGVPQSFFTVHNECGSTFVEPLKSKKKYQTASEIPFEGMGAMAREVVEGSEGVVSRLGHGNTTCLSGAV